MPNFPNPKCSKCAHYQQGICLLTNAPSKDINFCQYYTESPYICELCGNHLPSESVTYISGNSQSYHLLCANCASKIGTCNNCINAQVCKFNSDNTLTEPLYVIKEIRQGPMVSRQQVKNPKRIQLTCATGCLCYHGEECQKQNDGSCKNYSCAVKNW